MSTVEHCGRDSDHNPHAWQEGSSVEPERHRCPGGSVTEEEEDADDRRVELFERGFYDPVEVDREDPARWRMT